MGKEEVGGRTCICVYCGYAFVCMGKDEVGEKEIMCWVMVMITLVIWTVSHINR